MVKFIVKINVGFFRVSHYFTGSRNDHRTEYLSTTMFSVEPAMSLYVYVYEMNNANDSFDLKQEEGFKRLTNIIVDL